jgi:hypothetical protein
MWTHNEASDQVPKRPGEQGSRSRTGEVTERRVCQAEPPAQAPSIGQLLKQIHDDSVQTQFMQASALLKPLQGNEGRTQAEAYFRHFEAMTNGWDAEKRACLLAIHLEGHAKLAFEALSDRDKLQYEMIKGRVLQGSANSQSFRAIAQNEIFDGMQRQPGESLMDFGLRVLRTVRDSVLPGTSERTVEDLAIGHFLRYVEDPGIHSALAVQRHELSFHQMLDKAVMLKAMSDAARYGQARPMQHQFEGGPRQQSANFTPVGQRGACYNCGKTGHQSENCRAQRRQQGMLPPSGNARVSAVEQPREEDPQEAIIRAVLGDDYKTSDRRRVAPPRESGGM